jgi:hypothetical protein
MVIASTQTFRHAYVKWIEPTDSVLDQFKTGVDSDIATAKDISDLVDLYAAANTVVLEYEANPDNPVIEGYKQRTTPPYESRFKLREEIERRENQQKQVSELCFYWASGLISILIGLWAFRKINAWIGMSAVIVGFSEMLCWTSPLLHRTWAGNEFVTLLNYKLFLSACTWAFLIVLWLSIARGNLLTESKS